MTQERWTVEPGKIEQCTLEREISHRVDTRAGDFT